MTRPSRDEVLMRTAELWALRSTCTKPNGAVISRDGRIVSIGYNGSPPGHPHCIDVGCLNDPQGGCLRTIHAEANAIAWASRNGVATNGATIHCTSSPCLACAKLLVSAGVSKVVFRTPYRDPGGISVLMQSDVEVIHLCGELDGIT